MIDTPESTRDLIQFKSRSGGYLVGSWGIPKGVTSNYPLVVLLTGDGPNGSKGQTWQQLVPLLLAKGIGTFLFDFSGLGHSPGVYKDLTLTIGRENFQDVMAYLANSGSHSRNRIGVIGSSFGGNVALLEAANYPEIVAVGLKSASTFMPEGYEREIGSEKMEKWGRENYLEEIGHTYAIVLDALFHNAYEAARLIEAPVRIVHGTKDSSVPIRHARDLLRVLKNGSIFEIEGADHWYAQGDEWKRMADDLTAFMEKTL